MIPFRRLEDVDLGREVIQGGVSMSGAPSETETMNSYLLGHYLTVFVGAESDTNCWTFV